MSTAALDRQIRPIYDALDTGSNKSAIVGCNKLLKKHPKNELVKALKALALVRSQKVEESLVLCDEVLESKPTNEAVLTAMMHVLRGLGRHTDLITMFDEAFKKQPANEDLGVQTFFANVRANNWKSAHQVATRMNKQFQEDRYLYWSILSAVLQAKDIATPDAMRPILLKLAHRLITSSPTPSYIHPERFHLHLSILFDLELWDEADKLIDSDIGKNIFATSLSCDEIRRLIWSKQGRLQQEAERAQKVIVEKKDRNWLEFLAVIDATLPSTSSSPVDLDVQPKIHHAKELFTKVVEEDGLRDRSGHLALLELERRQRLHNVKPDSDAMTVLVQKFFDSFGNKACCFEDLKPYLTESAALHGFIAHLESIPKSFTTVSELQQLINAFKGLRYIIPPSEDIVEIELQRVDEYIKCYFEGLPLGVGLSSTELQPADDLLLLAGNAYINLWKLTGDDNYLLNAVYLLEFGVMKSKPSFQARLILIRIYRLLGAPFAALEHYRVMQVKQIQHDTLSHLILSRASTYSLASIGDLALSSECLEATHIYLSNSQETGEYISRAFNGEKYSKIPEFLAFEDHLDNSLQRDLIKLEHVRMRLTHESITTDLIDMELIELKFIFDRNHHDNRDYDVFPNYQHRDSESLHGQTTLFGKQEGKSWLLTFLKLYIRAFQQASDLDDTVEEKLLIGDRPKQAATANKRTPLKERLVEQDPDYLSELTSDEAKLVEYAHSLANWLECYHDYTRPPPSVVLAEAAKQTELKTGHPLKGIEITPTASSNGHYKREEDPPAIQEPPEIVTKFFSNIKSRFDEVATSRPAEMLHVATLAQEAFLILIVETLRFKSPSVVKINRLGPLVNKFKELRSVALSTLKNIATQLVKRGECYGSAESRKALVARRLSILEHKIDQDFVATQVRKTNDARKKVLEGAGKGMLRIATTYAT